MIQKHQVDTTMSRKRILGLSNLEEETLEDPTPFMTYVTLKETIGFLYDLEQVTEERIYEKVDEQPPLVGVFDRFEMLATDRKDRIHKIGAMSKGVIHEQRLKKLERNPTLAHLCNINNSKVYYNIVEDEFWLEVYQPTWINHKRTLEKVSSIKLETHDIETLEAFCFAHRRGFCNPLPNQIWVGKCLKRKIEKICEAFNERGEWKILEKPSRKNHGFG